METYLLHLLGHLDRRRFEPFLICPANSGTLNKKARKLGIEVKNVQLERSISPISDFMSLVKIVKEIRRINPGLIHLHSSKAGVIGRIAAALTSKVTIYTPHAYAYLGASGLMRLFYLAIEKALRPLTNYLIASGLSEKVRSVEEVGYRPEMITYASLFELLMEMPKEVSSQAASSLVLMIGRLNYQKNPEMFVRAARVVAERIPNACFKIVGSGFQEYHGEVAKKLISSLGLKKKFEIVKWMDRKSLFQIMGKAAIIVVPSRYESLGYAVLEAMFIGKPVVATRVDAIKVAVIDGTTGYLVELDDDQAMAERIIQLLDDASLREKMGRAGRKWVAKHFNIAKNIRKIETVYVDVCELWHNRSVPV